MNSKSQEEGKEYEDCGSNSWRLLHFILWRCPWIYLDIKLISLCLFSFIFFLYKFMYTQWQKVVIPSLRWYIRLIYIAFYVYILVPVSCYPINALINLSCKYLLIMSGHLLYAILYMFLLVWRSILPIITSHSHMLLCRYFMLA